MFKRHASTQDSPQGKNGRRKPGFIRRIVNSWGDRLLNAVFSGSLSDQKEEYEAHRTSRDYIWNTAGITTWGMVFPLLTIIITQLVGVEQAGMFTLAFVTGSLLMIVANYGVRTYQVSDINEDHSFADYRANRWFTCIAMLLIGLGYCFLRGYEGQMLLMSIGIYIYKMIDGLADVYEGRLQQKDKLYLSGISQTIRSVLAFVVFVVFLLITRDLVVASMAMAVAAGITFVVITFPLALLETPKSRRFQFEGAVAILKQCFPLFIALFMYALVDNMPKFVMEGVLTYDNQLYFNAFYFPAQAILLTVGFLYKPLLVRMATAWADFSQRKRFDLFIFAVLAIIIGVTIVVILLMGWIGIPIMSFLYGVDFGTFESLIFIMIVAGGITGGIDFLYQVITVIRRQKVVAKLYLITFGFSLLILPLLINMTGLTGAVIGYLIVMCILFVLLAMEYVRVRIEYARHPEADPVLVPSNGSAAAEAKRAYSAAGHRASTVARQPREASSEAGIVPAQEEQLSEGRHSASTTRTRRESPSEHESRPARGERTSQEKHGEGATRSPRREHPANASRSEGASSKSNRPAKTSRSTSSDHSARQSHSKEGDHAPESPRRPRTSGDDPARGPSHSTRKNGKT